MLPVEIRRRKAQLAAEGIPDVDVDPDQALVHLGCVDLKLCVDVSRVEPNFQRRIF